MWIRSGCCAECGYDLRSSPLRCPECAAVPDPAERARVAATQDCGVLRYKISVFFPLADRCVRFDRFSDRARLVVGLASNAMWLAGDTVLCPRHVVAALAVEGRGVGAEMLRGMGADLPGLAERLAPGLRREEEIRMERHHHVASESQLLLHSAMAEATFLGDERVCTEHLVLAVLGNCAMFEDDILRALSGDYHTALAMLLQFRAYGRFRDGQIEQALSICDMLLCEPTAAAMNLKAWILAVVEDERFHRPSEALDLAKRACEVSGYKEPAYLDTLAACCAANGDFAQAVHFAERAVAMAPEAKAPMCRARLDLFRGGKRYFESRGEPCVVGA